MTPAQQIKRLVAIGFTAILLLLLVSTVIGISHIKGGGQLPEYVTFRYWRDCPEHFNCLANHPAMHANLRPIWKTGKVIINPCFRGDLMRSFYGTMVNYLIAMRPH